MKKLTNKTTWTIFIIIIILFTLGVSTGLDKTIPGDDYTYFYMAKLMTEGKMFYKDFFFSHPPLHLLIISLVYKIFGFNIIALRSIEYVSQLIAVFFLFKIVKDKFDNLTALVFSFIYLSSYLLMLMSTYVYGINITTMFVAIGLYFLLSRKKHLLSGLFFGLAGLTGLYSLPLTLITMVFIFFKERKKYFKFLLGFSLIFVLVNLIFLLLYGKNYFIPVYKYHLLKPKQEGNFVSVFFKTLKQNLFIFFTPLLLFFIKKKDKVYFYGLLAAVHFAFLLFLNKIFDFYFILMFPLLAIIGAYSLTTIIKRFKKNKITIFFVLLMIFGAYSYPLYNRLIRYDYFDFDFPEIVDFLKYRTDETDTIFGDSGLTPMLALLSNRRITANIIDTNLLVIQSGVIDINKIINHFETKKSPDYIILREGYEIARVDALVNYVKNECKIEFAVKDPIWHDIYVFRC